MRALLTTLLPLVAASSVRFPVVQNDIKFNSGVDTIKSSQLGDVLSALNGYTIHAADPWKGIHSYNPIKHPSLYLITEFELIPEQPEILMNTNLVFNLENDNYIENEFKEFKQRAVNRTPRADGTMKVVGASEETPERLAEAASVLKDDKFDIEKKADRSFLLEYYTFKTIIAEMSDTRTTNGSSPSTAYFINFKSMRHLAEEYGLQHKKTERAAQLFSKVLGFAAGNLESHERSLFVVIQENEIAKIRAKRDLPIVAKAPGDDIEDWNLAHQYDTDFHIVFAITAFTLLIFVLGVLATSIGLWFMDPGRDSIIYRMTSQRMKME